MSTETILKDSPPPPLCGPETHILSEGIVSVLESPRRAVEAVTFEASGSSSDARWELTFLTFFTIVAEPRIPRFLVTRLVFESFRGVAGHGKSGSR